MPSPLALEPGLFVTEDGPNSRNAIQSGSSSPSGTDYDSSSPPCPATLLPQQSEVLEGTRLAFSTSTAAGGLADDGSSNLPTPPMLAPCAEIAHEMADDIADEIAQEIAQEIALQHVAAIASLAQFKGEYLLPGNGEVTASEVCLLVVNYNAYQAN